MARRISKRILITTDFYDPVKNGVGTYIHTLISFFPEAEFTILTHNRTQAPAKEHNGNVTIVRMPATISTGVLHIGTMHVPFPPIAVPVLAKHDLVITNTRFFSTTLIGTRLAQQWRVPRIHVEHGNMHVPHPNPFVRLCAWGWDQTIGRLVFRSADRVVCVSRKGLAFTNSLGARKPLYIPNALQQSEFSAPKSLRAQTRKHYGIALDARVIVFIGRLNTEKGVFELCDAANSNDVLLFVGDGPARKQLERRVHDLGVRAVFTGSLDASGVRAALHAADVFVNPSWAEGLPTSVLEALAAGVPVIATDVGGTSELLPKANLVPAQDVPALRARLQRPIKRVAFPKAYSARTAEEQWAALISSFA